MGVAASVKTALMQGSAEALLAISSVRCAEGVAMYHVLELEENQHVLKRMAKVAVSMLSTIGAQWLGFKLQPSISCS